MVNEADPPVSQEKSGNIRHENSESNVRTVSQKAVNVTLSQNREAESEDKNVKSSAKPIAAQLNDAVKESNGGEEGTFEIEDEVVGIRGNYCLNG